MKKIFMTEHKRLELAIDQILEGNADKIDISQFKNRKYVEKINDLIEYTKVKNNPTVMRLNSAMGVLGDNTLIKQTFDQVGIQSSLLSGMQESHQNIESSIGDISSNMGNIRENTQKLLTNSGEIVSTMSDNLRGVQISTSKLEQIDRELLEFRKNIATIHKIVDSVQNIARESNILALNASIEAGRAGEAGLGFNIIAENMRVLSGNVQESSEEIGQYVKEIESAVDNIASSMDDTTKLLLKENESTENSLSEMDTMNNQLTDIKERLDSIFNAIDLQTNATYSFANQMKDLFNSNAALSEDCILLGKQMFKIGRYNDKTRSDLLKTNANVHTRDLLSIFEVDHYVLTWRVYNNIVGFEQLKASQVDNPDGCKLGKWIVSNSALEIAKTAEFIAVKKAHEELHKFATNSFKAKENGDEELALAEFDRTLKSFYVLQKAIRLLDFKLSKSNDESITEYVAF